MHNDRFHSRRTLLRGGAAGLAAAVGPAIAPAGSVAGAQSTPVATLAGTSLSILQGHHSVPEVDQWFDLFLADWGTANGVATRVDRVDGASVPTTLETEIVAGQGHDLIDHAAPLPRFEGSVLNMADLVGEAANRHGPQLDLCRQASWNPATGRFHGFTYGFTPALPTYRKSMWTLAGMENGPVTYDDLLAGGATIWNGQGVMTALGMSPEMDSNLVAQGVIWAFGGSVQDEAQNITIDSPETVAAVTYMASLFERAMTPDVFGWDITSNDRLLTAGLASLVINPVSAYRATQIQAPPEIANDIFFVPPLTGPAGAERAILPASGMLTAMIPAHAAFPDTARAFLLHLVANAQAMAEAGKFSVLPGFRDTYANLTADGGPLDFDPFGSDPPDKLAVLKTAKDWTVNLGWPGPANAMIGEAFNTSILSDMMAKAARGDLAPADAVAEAETRLNEIARNGRSQA